MIHKKRDNEFYNRGWLWVQAQVLHDLRMEDIHVIINGTYTVCPYYRIKCLDFSLNGAWI